MALNTHIEPSHLVANALLGAPSFDMIRTDSVLVAEDDPISRSLLQAWLGKWDFDTRVVENGIDAWEALQQSDAPNLIILDWMMPGMDGVEICRRIRSRKSSLYPYILLLTSKDAKQDRVNALEAGADDFLTKPFDANELQARLNVGCRILNLQNDLRRKEEQLRFQVSHDHLTGLWSRGAILDFMENELVRARRSGNSLGVMLLDIDHFKKVNDTYGHAMGDAVLKQVAQRLPQGIRSYDWVGRYGGEEFLVLISNCTAETLARCAEQVRDVVASEQIRADGIQISITVSIGTAVSTPLMQSSGELLRFADAALYRAKSNGRNCVEVGW